ncbi:NAD(P)-binding protein [Violaceomyces palustris]|uniref:NAD(P)-binding protein n=1 Tax=Violaceomyces palustris TaxID=1673888 RepID=A0ACD0P745_9BASI|nr:NAD(P)-binding protein [Violaceomyces palustris]
MSSSAPSVYDTHCDGPGLLPTTQEWSRLYRFYRKYLCEISDTLPLPDLESPENDLRGKTVIVSGSNSGIGKEACIYFAKAGASVVMACRDSQSHEQHPKEALADVVRLSGCSPEKVEWWKVDFASLKSIHAFGQRWKESGRVCDILANNAGLSAGKRIITEDGLELTNSVNFLGHCLITFYVLPSMKRSVAPRIINTCSCFHNGGNLDFANFNDEKQLSGGLSGVQWYCDTKLRFLMWTVELQQRLSRSDDYRHVIAHGIHPGFVGSNIWNNPNFDLYWPIEMLKKILIPRLSITPEQGSIAILFAALDPSLGLPASVLSQGKDGKAGQPNPGVSAKYGGKFINRTSVNVRRPECDDPLARSRLWQRVLEDLDVGKSGGQLASDLPGHPEGLW